MSNTFYFTYFFEYTPQVDLNQLHSYMKEAGLGFNYERTTKSTTHLNCAQTPYSTTESRTDVCELNCCCPPDGLSVINDLEKLLPKPCTRIRSDDMFDDERIDVI